MTYRTVSPVPAVCLGLLVALVLTACSSTPPPPDWQMNAKSSLERATDAYLSGNDKVAAIEFKRARVELSRTGRPDLLAKAELTHCAARVASLVLEHCAGFDALRADATPVELAYADYLAGRSQPQDAALLPSQHRSVASGANTLPETDDALARLVAAGVLLQAARANPTVVAQAVDTASARGWRRPLLAWLGVQAKLAEQDGDAAEVERIRRRITLVQGRL